jgi:2-oxo-3-hexenedioate decarboxylase
LRGRTAADPRISRGLEAQLRSWRSRIDRGERRVGWKVALNVPAVQERLGISAPVIGALSSGGELNPGASHSLAGGTRVGIEPEVAVHISAAVPAGESRGRAAAAIEALGAAIEVVDIDMPFDDLERILARNVFQRAFMLGPALAERAGGDLGGVLAHVRRNGVEQESARAADMLGDLADVVILVADLLADAGEALAPGDVIISGSLTPIVWVEAGDRIEVDLGPLGKLETSFTAGPARDAGAREG